MKKYRVPDVTDAPLSDAGAGAGYFFPALPEPPEDGPLRFYCHRACLLLARNWEVEGVARRLGFPDGEHFSRSFSAYMGLAPEEYRRWATGRKRADKGLRKKK